MIDASNSAGTLATACLRAPIVCVNRRLGAELGGRAPEVEGLPYPHRRAQVCPCGVTARANSSNAIAVTCPVIGTAEPAGAFGRLQLHTCITQARIDERCSRSDEGAVEMGWGIAGASGLVPSVR